MRLIDELDELHAHYAEAINLAVSEDDFERANQLASSYDDESVQLIAEREGRTHLLPIRRPAHAESSLRGLVRRLRVHRAA